MSSADIERQATTLVLAGLFAFPLVAASIA